mmetsp:Transcript_54325/g.119119  ORF Transcript_54325/g.119119 Transcript_54325/m.119119 type:complete len:221 (-) Transcript_54325:121-783(-)
MTPARRNGDTPVGRQTWPCAFCPMSEDFIKQELFNPREALCRPALTVTGCQTAKTACPHFDCGVSMGSLFWQWRFKQGGKTPVGTGAATALSIILRNAAHLKLLPPPRARPTARQLKKKGYSKLSSRTTSSKTPPGFNIVARCSVAQGCPSSKSDTTAVTVGSVDTTRATASAGLSSTKTVKRPPRASSAVDSAEIAAPRKIASGVRGGPGPTTTTTARP